MPLQRADRPAPWKRFFRLLGMGVIAVVLAMVFVVSGINVWMTHAGAPDIYERLDAVPPMPVALVLGAGPNTPQFESRLDAAAELFRAGKVSHILVSGEGQAADPTGSETALMRAGLLSRGIPAAAITRDDYGFRTLDSVARARRVFQLKSVIIVTQRFHLPRALYLAQEWSLDATGYAAKDPGGDLYDANLREWLARVKAWLDIQVLHTEPRNLGPVTPIDLDAAPPTAKH